MPDSQAMVPAPSPTTSGPNPKPDESAARMSFFEHLEELRWRLLYSIIAVVVSGGTCFAWSAEIIQACQWPLAHLATKTSLKLITVAPTEAFVQEVKVALTCGLLISAPFLLLQLWLFIAPGLYSHEKRYVIPFVVLGTIFFAGGAAFCFTLVLPASLKYLLEITPPGIEAQWTLEFYLSLVLNLMMGFGLVFELPLVMSILGAIGLVTAKQFSAFRKYWIVIAAVVAGVVTPTPDALTMMLMAAPLWTFYELGILGARLLQRKPATA